MALTWAMLCTVAPHIHGNPHTLRPAVIKPVVVYEERVSYKSDNSTLRFYKNSVSLRDVYITSNVKCC